MMFCPKCGSILKPKADKTKKYLYCSCGYTNKDAEQAKLKETVSKEEKEIEVVGEEQDNLPTTDADCSKCGNNEAFYWLVQTRAGDEPETKFLKCTKCKHTWRDYS